MESETPQAEDAFEMCKQHPDFLSELHGDVVLLGLRDVSGNLSGVFVFFTGDRSGICVRAALLFRRAGLAGQLQGAVFGPTFTGWPPVRVGITPPELLQLLALGADVLVVLGVPFIVRPAPGAVDTVGFVEDGNMRGDLTIDQSAEPPRFYRRLLSFSQAILSSVIMFA